MVWKCTWSFNPCFSGCASWIYEPFCCSLSGTLVSILVLVDVPLECRKLPCGHFTKCRVSILVLVDVPLEYNARTKNHIAIVCFNPCFSGCASWIAYQTFVMKRGGSFNPCFSGCASWIWCKRRIIWQMNNVSILVLVDVPLEYESRSGNENRGEVSILVLVDVPLESEPCRQPLFDCRSFQSLF